MFLDLTRSIFLSQPGFYVHLVSTKTGCCPFTTRHATDEICFVSDDINPAQAF